MRVFSVLHSFTQTCRKLDLVPWRQTVHIVRDPDWNIFDEARRQNPGLLGDFRASLGWRPMAPQLPAPGSIPATAQPPAVYRTPQPPAVYRTPQPPAVYRTPQPPAVYRTPQPPAVYRAPLAIECKPDSCQAASPTVRDTIPQVPHADAVVVLAVLAALIMYGQSSHMEQITLPAAVRPSTEAVKRIPAVPDTKAGSGIPPSDASGLSAETGSRSNGSKPSAEKIVGFRHIST